jgi:WD40 repeat protein
MIKFRLQSAPLDSGSRDGELAACAYTPNDAQIISGGWDGMLRIWDASTGEETAAIQASTKPIIACAVSPDGKFYLSACLNGFLAHWEAQTRQKAAYFLAHWRPISCIVYDSQGRMMATSSWDKNLILWDLDPNRDGRVLTGHDDIVAGCCFTPQDGHLLSWSHDGTLKLWDVPEAKLQIEFVGHGDRVTAAAISADGRWAASGSRDQTLRIWDLTTGCQIACCTLASAICGCFFLSDGETILAVNDDGSLSLHRLPQLGQEAELLTDQRVLQAALAHHGTQLALACADGRLHRVELEGVERVNRSVPPSNKDETGTHRSTVGKRMRKLLQLARGGATEANS